MLAFDFFQARLKVNVAHIGLPAIYSNTYHGVEYSRTSLADQEILSGEGLAKSFVKSCT